MVKKITLADLSVQNAKELYEELHQLFGKPGDPGPIRYVPYPAPSYPDISPTWITRDATGMPIDYPCKITCGESNYTGPEVELFNNMALPIGSTVGAWPNRGVVIGGGSSN